MTATGNNVSKKSSSEVEEEKRFVEEKFTAIIQDFNKSGESSITFPSSLSAFERRIIHEISEKFKLSHISKGEGTERYIEVRKLPIVDTSNYIDLSNAFLTTENMFDEIKDISERVQDDKNESTVNLKPKLNKSEGKGPAVKNKQPQKPKLKALKLKETTDVEDDFDALIEQVIKADKICSFERCKKNIAALAQLCNFCRRRFCFEHFIPEVHGCGDAAKAHARSQIRKDRAIYPGSGKPEKKIDPIKQSYLQKKLDKKLSELSSQRKPKPKS